MSTLIIAVFVIFGLLIVASVILGRQSQEVESARDTEYLELDGTWIRYSIIGGGPPVLLVHGWLSSSRVWEGLAGRLAQRFTVYTLDLTGFGESDKPLSGYGVRNGSRLLYAFCAHFGLTRTSIVAHDLGGNMAVKLAADHPDVVGKLTLVAVPANEEQIDLPTPLWLATLPLVGSLFYALGRAVRPVRAMWMRPFVSDPEDLPEEVLDDAARSTPAAVQKSLSTTRREISGGRLARQARMLKGPLLLVAGEEDQIVDPQSVGTWSRIADGAEVVLIDGCGHLPMLERTSEFNAHVLAFLTGDARYLDLIERSPEPQVLTEEDDHDETDYPDERDPNGQYADGEAAWNEDPNDPQDDQIERADYDREPNERPIHEDRDYDERRRETHFEPRSDSDEDDTEILPPPPPEDDVPNVVRKRRGRYSRPSVDEREDVSFENESHGNGSERRVRPEPVEREPSRGDPIPEVPKDLFDWQSGWEEYRPRERRRGRSEDRTRDEGGGVDDPPETPRP